MKATQIDLAPFREELKELVGTSRLRFKIDVHYHAASSVREWDDGLVHGYDVALNPHRIRTEKQLEAHKNHIRQALSV